MFQIKNKAGNWVTVKEPKLGGLVVTDEPVWAANTGRGSDGTMIGDIIAWKTTIEVGWPPLSYAEAKALRDAIGVGDKTRNFFQIRYSDIEAGVSSGALQTVTKTVYIGNMPRLLYSLSPAYPRYQDITIQFIEQ